MRKNLAEAIRQHRLGKLDRAEAIYRKILSRQPDNPDALHFFGVLLHQKGESERAIRLIQRALHANPGYTDAHKNLGNVFKESGRPADAEVCYFRALELNPADADACNNLCVALKSQKRFGEAVEAGLRAVALNPHNPVGWFNLGSALKQSGQLERAVVAFTRTLALNPTFLPAHVDLCHSLYRLEKIMPAPADRLDERIKAYQGWIEVEPDNPVPRFMLAACQGDAAVPRAPDDFIRHLFDGFAASFDDNLASLGYRVPGLMAERLAPLAEGVKGALAVLDAGCGTGLCAHFLRPLARTLTGVDLSPGMLQVARGRKAYDALIEAELCRYLDGHPDAFDLIVSADTLIYFGDLRAVINAAAAALKSGGTLLFSLERLVDAADTKIFLNGAGRYQHAEDYVCRVLHDAGLKLRACDRESLRKESGQAVSGLIIEARKHATA